MRILRVSYSKWPRGSTGRMNRDVLMCLGRFLGIIGGHPKCVQDQPVTKRTIFVYSFVKLKDHLQISLYGLVIL